MSLTYSDNSPIADLSVKSITGRPGVGFYRLLFQVSIIQHRILDKEIWNSFREIRGQVQVGPPGSAHNYLGRISPEVPFVMDVQKSSPDYWHFFCLDLDSLQIERIEDLRNGGDIEFVLQLSGVADGDSGPHGSHEWVHYRANQSDWIKVLKEMEYQEFLLFEIPIPPENSSDELKQAAQYLNQAKDHLLKGYYEEVVGKCRLVLESVTKELEEESSSRSAIDVYCNDRKRKEDMTKNQRFLFLREAARHICHPPHHISDESYDRTDATCVLGVTAAILARSLR